MDNRTSELLKYFREHMKEKKAVTEQDIQDIQTILDIAEYEAYVDADSGNLVLSDGQLDAHDTEATPESVMAKAYNLTEEWLVNDSIIPEDNSFVQRYREFYESDGTYSLSLMQLYKEKEEEAERNYPKVSAWSPDASIVYLENGYIEKRTEGDEDYYDLYSDGLVCMDGEAVAFSGYTGDGKLRFINEMGESDAEFILTDEEFRSATVRYESMNIEKDNPTIGLSDTLEMIKKSERQSGRRNADKSKKYVPLSLERLCGEISSGNVFDNSEGDRKYFDLFDRDGDFVFGDGELAEVVEINSESVILRSDDPGRSKKFSMTPEEFRTALEDGIAREKENKEPDLPVILSYEYRGLECEPVTITAEARPGIEALDIIGLPDSRVRETRETIRAAAEKSGSRLPKGRLMLTAEPVELRKRGEHSLALALSAAASGGEIPSGTFAAGKLLSDGSIERAERLTGALEKMRDMGIRTYILPEKNLDEIEKFEFPEGAEVRIASSMREALEKSFVPTKSVMKEENMDDVEYIKGVAFPKVDDRILDEKITVNRDALRAAMIAAAGRHNLLLYGSPGCGKTMLAQRLGAALPALDESERTEVMKVWNAAGLGPYGAHGRPLRMPHQSASFEGMLGGGDVCRPGEISLANKGVLMLDETQEFRSGVIQAMRHVMEHRGITLSRAGESFRYPADFQLIMTANPCACGNSGEAHICLCSEKSKELYWEKMKPLADAAELKAHVYSAAEDRADEKFVTVSAREIRERIAGAITVQRARGISNHDLGDLNVSARTAGGGENLFKKYIEEKCGEKMGLQDEIDLLPKSDKGRIAVTICQMYSVARTIADLDGRDIIERGDLAEAALYTDFSPASIPSRNARLGHLAESMTDRKLLPPLNTVTPEMTGTQKKIHEMFDYLFYRDGESAEEWTKGVVAAAGSGDLSLNPEFMNDENKDKWWKLAVDHAVNSGGALWQSSYEREGLLREFGITGRERLFGDPDKEYGRLMRIYLKDTGALSDELYHETVRREKERRDAIDSMKKDAVSAQPHFSGGGISEAEKTRGENQTPPAKSDGGGPER